jgi:hypothetical protein
MGEVEVSGRAVRLAAELNGSAADFLFGDEVSEVSKVLEVVKQRQQLKQLPHPIRYCGG